MAVLATDEPGENIKHHFRDCPLHVSLQGRDRHGEKIRHRSKACLGHMSAQGTHGQDENICQPSTACPEQMYVCEIDRNSAKINNHFRVRLAQTSVQGSDA